ncbi:hypothetical protein PISMIDRAFT_6912 [Pisolithus microcarpus 441]|uniref:Uncharacterized protein n=1 Tax=Pisolithus microcarpus 441 TaxID=765257 RepID=A0A0D0A5I3_9AGAM|nr:hypothetical protein PISMIDRAFT_6912 [Pisolithus microcarpus 441]
MSQQPQGTSCQTTTAPSWDWTRVPDEELELMMDDSKGTKQAKEVERDWWEMVKKQRRAEVCRQRAEEAWQHKEEEHQRSEEECLAWERAKQEWRAQEEHERQRAKEAAKQTASSKGKGYVEELQREGQLVQMARMGSMPIYSPMTGAKLSEMAVLIYWAACDECQQRGEAQECWVAVGGRSCRPCRKRKKKCSWAAEDREASTSGVRKWAGTGGSWGKKKKRGQSGAKDEEVNEEVGVNEGSKMSAPRFKVAGSHLVGERELRCRLPPDDKYHGWLLIAQEQQVMAMEWQAMAMERMAAAQEAQAVTIQVYVQVMQGQMWPLFPLTMAPWVGVPQGRAMSATGVADERGGSGTREGTKSGGSERGDSGDEQGDEMDNE